MGEPIKLNIDGKEVVVYGKAQAAEVLKAHGKEVKEPETEPERPPLDATEAAVALAIEHGIDLYTVTGTGQDGRITKGDVEKLIGE